MFQARRKPKRIGFEASSREASPGQTDSGEWSSFRKIGSTNTHTPHYSHRKSSQNADSLSAEEDGDTGPAVRRPNASKRFGSKLKVQLVQGDEDEDEILTVKKPLKLSGQKIERERLDEGLDRPLYDADSLKSLRASTTIRPIERPPHSHTEDELNSKLQGSVPSKDETIPITGLDIHSKFGPLATTSHNQNNPNDIPSAAQIIELKSRRARLAKEHEAQALQTLEDHQKSLPLHQQDFISLDDDDEFNPKAFDTYNRDSQAISSYKPSSPEHESNSRLIPEDQDENLAEGYSTFTDDVDPTLPSRVRNPNRLLMSRVNPAQTVIEEDEDRRAMRKLIDNAEGLHPDLSSNSGDTDSDAEENLAFMSAQIQHGLTSLSSADPTGRSRKRLDVESRRPKQPSKITTIPSLKDGLGRLEEMREQTRLGKGRCEVRIEEIRRRLKECEIEKVRVQGGLDELGARIKEEKEKERNKEEDQWKAQDRARGSADGNDVNGGENGQDNEALDEQPPLPDEPIPSSISTRAETVQGGTNGFVFGSKTPPWRR